MGAATRSELQDEGQEDGVRGRRRGVRMMWSRASPDRYRMTEICRHRRPCHSCRQHRRRPVSPLPRRRRCTCSTLDLQVSDAAAQDRRPPPAGLEIEVEGDGCWGDW
eukprot:45811-Pyramimonas_sp.AAC.1